MSKSEKHNSIFHKYTEMSPMSRKWFLTLLILFIATCLCFIPPVISMWVFHAASPLIILDGSYWVVVVSILTGTYSVANLFQKKIEGVAEKIVDKLPKDENQVDDAAKNKLTS